MLILTRRHNESIIIGDMLVKFTVVDIRDDKVRIGIDAPRELSVHRGEIYEAIVRQSQGGNQSIAHDNGDKLA